MAAFRVFYMKPNHFRSLILGDTMPSRAALVDTHVELKTVEASGLEAVYRMMQGEFWSPNGEARTLIEQKGLAHTSMSVGDVIENVEAGEFFAVAPVGFKAMV